MADTGAQRSQRRGPMKARRTTVEDLAMPTHTEHNENECEASRNPGIFKPRCIIDVSRGGCREEICLETWNDLCMDFMWIRSCFGAGKDPGGLRHFGAVGLLSFCSVLSDPSGLQIAKGPWHPT